MASKLNTVTEVLHVASPEAYKELHVWHGNNKPQGKFVPRMSIEVKTAYVGAGTWRIRCECGEAPSTHPEWKIACCSGCGWVYQDVVFPAQILEIERILLLRANYAHRNWLPLETVDDLKAQNIARGEAIE